MDENEKREKTPEEIYLDELYKAMETGDMPDGMIPLQVPSLNDPKQQFRKIELPVKRKRTLPEHVASTAMTLSSLYLLVGFFVFREATRHEDTRIEMLALLFWVFVIGAVMAAIGAVMAIFLKEKMSLVWKLFPFVIFAASITMLTFVI